MLARLCGAALLMLAYSTLWQPATWVYNDRSLVNPTTITMRRSLEQTTWAMTSTPRSARLLNLLLHSCNVLLVGLLLYRLGVGDRVASIVALAWALHPLHVETVAYAAGRSELLAATGILIAVLATAANGRGWGVWALLGIGLGLAAKESAIVVLALIPFVRISLGYRWRLTATACGAAIVAAIVWFGGPEHIINQEIYSAQITMSEWLLIQSTAAMRLMWLSIVPIRQTIDFDYDLVSHGVRVICVIALLAWAGVSWRMRHTLIGIGLVWTIISIAPRLVVQTPRSYLNEHQFYTPSIGLALAIARRKGGA